MTSDGWAFQNASSLVGDIEDIASKIGDDIEDEEPGDALEKLEQLTSKVNSLRSELTELNVVPSDVEDES